MRTPAELLATGELMSTIYQDLDEEVYDGDA
jgi:hypothetical protein